MLLSLPAVAERLGVDERRIRQRIADGSLRAEKVGGRWLLDEADLIGLSERRRGRPVSHDSAWALIGAAAAWESRAEGAKDPASALLDRVAAAVRSRSKARLKDVLEQVRVKPAGPSAEEWSDRAATNLRVLLRNRAARRAYSASPRDLDDLRADDRLELSGLSLPESGIASGVVVEGYVCEVELGPLADDYLLAEVRESEANVFLHVVPSGDSEHWRAARQAVSSRLVLAVDLAEHRRPREEARAAELVYLLANLDPA